MTDRRSFQKHEIDPEERLEAPSKSAVKREMTALQALGEQLAALPDKQFKKMDFGDEALQDALEFFRQLPTKQREARRRQLQLIGRQMRRVDPQALTTQLHRLQGFDAEDKRNQMQAEQWRSRLLEQPPLLTDFVSQYGADAGQLNPLLRSALKAAQQHTDRGEARALYRALLDAIRH